MKHKIVHGILVFLCLFCLSFALVPSCIYGIWNIGVLFLYAVGIAFLLLLRFYAQISLFLKKHRKIGVSAVILFFLAFGAFCFANGILFQYAYGKQPSSENARDTVVVLGCQIIGDRPSLSLQKRLDKATEYLSSCPEANCIVTGGIGKGKQYSEAEIMKRYLMEKGIEPSRIYLEDRSTGTRENLNFAMSVAQQNQLSTHFVIVSDNYHQYRAAVYRQRDFSKTAAHLSSDGPWGIVPCYWMREVLGVFYLFAEGI